MSSRRGSEIPRRLLIAIVLIAALYGCGDDDPDTPVMPCDPTDPGDEGCAIITPETLARDDLLEVVPCRLSHDHDLRYIRAVADTPAAMYYRLCVLSPGACDDPFPTGSLFLKYEYDDKGCQDDDLLAYTAALKLDADALPAGQDWRWQRLSTDLDVVEDGAPERCLSCHTFHCAAPNGLGHDLRCFPD